MDTRSFWTDEGDLLLRRRLAEKPGHGLDYWHELAREFPGRTAIAIRTRANYFRKQDARAKHDVLSAAEQVIRQQSISLPPPSSLTAWFFGDPLPGRSALDLRMKNMNQGATANA